LIFAAIFADVIAPPINDPVLGSTPAYAHQNLLARNQFPSSDHFFGTDHLGRDIFSRVVHGSRVSLLIGFVVLSISMTLGTALGAISGFYGGKVDSVIMRIIDIVLAIPGTLLAISIAAALGPGLINLMVAVGISAMPGYARLVRATVLSLRGQEFIEAARSIGASDPHLIIRHIIPNCMAPVIVQGTLGMANAILSAASLSFIGLGIEPPTPEWGAMLSQGRDYVLSGFWPSTVFPGLAIAFVIFGLNMMGDGLRDAFDPRLKR
jgi:peptide/nickel transport system permease protein